MVQRLLPALRLGSEVAGKNWRICVDAPVTKEGPVATRLLDHLRIARGDKNRGLRRRLGHDAAEWIGDERMSEELDSLGRRLILVADAVRRRHEDAVGNGM